MPNTFGRFFCVCGQGKFSSDSFVDLCKIFGKFRLGRLIEKAKAGLMWRNLASWIRNWLSNGTQSIMV